MPNDPAEIVQARYVTSLAEPTKIITPLNPTVDFIVNGDVIRMSRREAEERDDFVIVGEESTTSGAVVRVVNGPQAEEAVAPLPSSGPSIPPAQAVAPKAE